MKDQHKTTEAKYPTNFNKSNSFLFVNAVKQHQFKEKDLEIKPYPIFLGNILKDFTVDFTIDNLKKTGFKGSVKVFSVDYNAIDTSNILDIHRFVMKET